LPPTLLQHRGGEREPRHERRSSPPELPDASRRYTAGLPREHAGSNCPTMGWGRGDEPTGVGFLTEHTYLTMEAQVEALLELL
jgi:hypothetical protein